MASRLAGLLIAGFTAALIATGAPVHADQMAAWEEINQYYCHLKPGEDPINPKEDKAGAAEQFSDEAAIAYQEAYEMTPREYVEDPFVASRPIVMNPDFNPDWAFPKADSASRGDTLRLHRFLWCTDANFKEAWTNAITTQREKFDQGFKKEFENNPTAIQQLYRDKMKFMKDALQAEQKRRGIEAEWPATEGELSPKRDDDD
ncbi:hypothetical protein [Nocardia brasiliensis]|uniref:hypothetical protein n=1 Tax=Nocardia brasiliensis TaxID=37326 RepID=UPI00366DF4ED